MQEELTSYEAAMAAYRSENWEADSSAVIVLDESLLRFGANGEGFLRRHTLTRLDSPDAFARYGEIVVPNAPGRSCWAYTSRTGASSWRRPSPASAA